jgi:hypothetical protein
MKNRRMLITIAAAIVALLGISSAVAQPRKGAANRRYDTKTVETVQGKVLSIEKTSPPGSRRHGIHLMLKTDKETIPVHLGPAWYVDKQTPRIEANDTITVTGSRITIDGKETIIAAQVKKGDEILKLRDENGVPAWSGAGRRGR